MDFFDAYVVRARLFPAVIAVAPALTLLLLAGSWTDPGLPEIISSLGIAVLLFAGADLARRAGLRKERKLFAATGGRPYNTELTRADDSVFDEVSKAEYRAFLAAKVNRQVPSEAEETADPIAAMAFYNACFRWLRENTRDRERFHVLLGENITYGFRRNMWGLKWFGIAINLGTVAAAYAIYRYEPQFMSVSNGKLVAQGSIAAIHAIYLLVGVSKNAVLDASKTYARQLALTVEALKSS
ncbi:hypothetical protein [Paracoccus hibiscisoli]|uniref:Uncharacterized protein n=1 Tax=Paracoccus hibiscisoli TaxID=2023261 RepID=A0A4U0Q8Y0_9RHOB|nr:hypothetical protein [Paracoccus hibiscisoli]TJZ77706.1 hypothetical protein FA740_18985 [Paracoccus hibiscisoli]